MNLSAIFTKLEKDNTDYETNFKNVIKAVANMEKYIQDKQELNKKNIIKIKEEIAKEKNAIKRKAREDIKTEVCKRVKLRLLKRDKKIIELKNEINLMKKEANYLKKEEDKKMKNISSKCLDAMLQVVTEKLTGNKKEKKCISRLLKQEYETNLKNTMENEKTKLTKNIKENHI